MEVRFSDDDLRRLAEQLAPLIADRLPTAPAGEGWLDARAAAAYAGCTISSLHKAMAAREVRFSQAVEGGKAWFQRAWIDAWRNGEHPC
jgi:ATP-dependent DNA ligase